MTRKFLIVVLVMLGLSLGACTSTSGVQPGDGPAQSADSTSPQVNPEGQPSDPGADQSSSEPAAKTADFHEKYIYEDGVQVEVIRIEHGKVTRAQAEYSNELKPGEPWVKLAVRVKNGSKVRLDADSSWNMTYGPDGTEARTMYIDGVNTENMTGKILPGRSKTASELFSIPLKYQNNPVLEYNFDLDHEAAIFTGSLR